MSQIRVLNESELLHRHQLTAHAGYYVVEEHDAVPATAGQAARRPVPDILEGPIETEPQAIHIAETRFGMKREAG